MKHHENNALLKIHLVIETMHKLCVTLYALGTILLRIDHCFMCWFKLVT